MGTLLSPAGFRALSLFVATSPSATFVQARCEMRRSTKRLFLAGLLGVLVGVVQIALAQSSSPFVGTWKMNVAKSTANPGPPNKSGTTKIDAAGKGVMYTVDNVTGSGTKQHWEFTANYDGKDVPVSGNSPYGDSVAATRINANTMRLVNKKSGKVTATLTVVVSADGKTRTGHRPRGRTRRDSPSITLRYTRSNKSLTTPLPSLIPGRPSTRPRRHSLRVKAARLQKNR